MGFSPVDEFDAVDQFNHRRDVHDARALVGVQFAQVQVLIEGHQVGTLDAGGYVVGLRLALPGRVAGLIEVMPALEAKLVRNVMRFR
jgi:hypothetical protein